MKDEESIAVITIVIIITKIVLRLRNKNPFLDFTSTIAIPLSSVYHSLILCILAIPSAIPSLKYHVIEVNSILKWRTLLFDQKATLLFGVRLIS